MKIYGFGTGRTLGIAYGFNVVGLPGTAGSVDGLRTSALFSSITALTMDRFGSVYVVDSNTLRVGAFNNQNTSIFTGWSGAANATNVQGIAPQAAIAADAASGSLCARRRASRRAPPSPFSEGAQRWPQPTR